MANRPTFEKGYVEAKSAAQRIAFGPMIFQAVRVLRERGVLARLLEAEDAGVSLDELQSATGITRYGLEVLLESALVSDVVSLVDPSSPDRYRLTKTGYFFERDTMTRVNVDFVAEICYRALDHLSDAIRDGKPSGLKELGDWPTVYEGLAELSERQRKAWFAFDHFYSDGAFGAALQIVFDRPRQKLLDVGGNTGRFAREVLARDADVHVTIVDLPGQLRAAEAALGDVAGKERVSFAPTNLLDPNAPLPQGHDVIWMSQFLDCFSEPQIVSILERARAALLPDGELFILETLWDRQAADAAQFVVVQTSLYFTAVANGNSKMYHSKPFLKLIEDAGFEVKAQHDRLGLTHTLLRCAVRQSP